MKSWLVLFLYLIAFSGFSNSGAATDFKLATPIDARYASYELKLLKIALDHLKGDHSLSPVPTKLSQGRALHILADGKADFNVYYAGYSARRAKILHMIPVPLTRGLLGHRLLLVKTVFMPRIARSAALANLVKTITLGTGISWPDTDVLRLAGFQVVTGPVQKLLDRGRVDAIPIGMHESRDFQSLFGGTDAATSPYQISPHHLLSYRYDSFFFVARSDTKRAAMIEEGLTKAYESGAFMEHFKANPDIAEGLEFVARHQPQLLHIASPMDSETLDAIPAPYWHHIQAEAETAPTDTQGAPY